MSESAITIGPYTIQDELGSGGMGTVYRAFQTETSDLVAIKVLSATMAREPGLVERFRREIDSLQKLTNPHIVRFLDSGEHEGTYYYAMELVEGETLTERLNRVKRIGWETVIEMAVQVCRALKAAHDAGIIHRDLKPGNLMLSNDDLVKLTDFGVAQIFAAGKLTATGGIVGTAEYMSPEQAQGRKAHRTSDLYSLGAVMYCMLTGRPPFSGRSTVEIIQQHRYGQFDPPRSIVPEIPRWLDEVVCRLLSKDPTSGIRMRMCSACVCRKFREKWPSPRVRPLSPTGMSPRPPTPQRFSSWPDPMTRLRPNALATGPTAAPI